MRGVASDWFHELNCIALVVVCGGDSAPKVYSDCLPHHTQLLVPIMAAIIGIQVASPQLISALALGYGFGAAAAAALYRTACVPLRYLRSCVTRVCVAVPETLVVVRAARPQRHVWRRRACCDLHGGGLRGPLRDVCARHDWLRARNLLPHDLAGYVRAARSVDLAILREKCTPTLPCVQASRPYRSLALLRQAASSDSCRHVYNAQSVCV